MIKTWSYSRYSTYKACPRKAKYAYVDYIKEPSNEYMERGTKYHDLAEKFIKGELKRFPKELDGLKHVIVLMRDGFKAGEVFTEHEWGFNSDWNPCEYKGAWLKMKIDCAASDESDRMVIIDWKTGKYNSDRVAGYLEQLSLYALGTFIMYPNINIIEPRIGFLDHGIMYPVTKDLTYYREHDYRHLLQEWISKANVMLDDTEFICNNSFVTCRWCYYNVNNPDGPQLCNCGNGGENEVN